MTETQSLLSMIGRGKGFLRKNLSHDPLVDSGINKISLEINNGYYEDRCKQKLRCLNDYVFGFALDADSGKGGVLVTGISAFPSLMRVLGAPQISLIRDTGADVLD